MSAAYQELDYAWASLGINYVIPSSKWNAKQDPEDLIVRSLPAFFEDPRLLSMMIAWAQEYRELINVGRLESYLNGLNPFEMSVLGAISKKLKSDEKWLRLYHKIDRKIGQNRPMFLERDLYFKLAEVSGRDEDFAEFGICIPQVSKADRKKLKPKQVIAEKNYWFRFRKLFENHMRADVAVAMYILELKNAYQVKKLLRCSQETAYRQYKSLSDPITALQIEALINKDLK